MRPVALTLMLFALLAVPIGAQAQDPQDTDDVSSPEEEETAEAEEAAKGATEAPTTDEPTEADPADDLQQLRAEYFKIRDRLFQSRARSSAVSSALYSSRLSLDLNFKSGRYYTVTRATIRLDGANIFDDSEGTIASDKATRFQGFIAPGRHQVNIRIEATGKDDDRFSTVVDNSFVVQAIKGKDLIIKATAQDDGNMAYKWSKKESGSYQLHLDVSVKSAKRGKKKNDHIKRTGELRKHGPAKTNRS